MHEVASHNRKRGFISEMVLTKSKSQGRGDRQMTRDHVKRIEWYSTGSGLNKTQDGNNYMCISRSSRAVFATRGNY